MALKSNLPLKLAQPLHWEEKKMPVIRFTVTLEDSLHVYVKISGFAGNAWRDFNTPPHKEKKEKKKNKHPNDLLIEFQDHGKAC